MISKTFRIARMIVLARFVLASFLASLAVSSAAAAATCSNASLNGTYGFQHDGTDSNGTPLTAAVTQITFDATTGTFTGETYASHDGVIAIQPVSGTYTIGPNCTGTGTPAAGTPFTIVVTSSGFLALHVFSEGFAVKQGSPICTNAGVRGSYGFETTGVFLANAPSAEVAFVGELKFTVNAAGEGRISGQLSASEDGTFVEEPATGYYQITADCRGTAVIRPKGSSSAMHFRLVIVDGGRQMLAVETDANTVVSGTLQR